MGLPVLEEKAKLQFVKLYEWSNTAALAGLPVGWFEWGDRKFEVYCATFDDFARAEKILGRPPVGGGSEHVAIKGTPREIALLAEMALGGIGRCPLTERDLLRSPLGFSAALREAVLVFFWAGPFSSRTVDVPAERTAPSATRTEADLMSKVASSTPASGTKAARLSTSGKR